MTILFWSCSDSPTQNYQANIQSLQSNLTMAPFAIIGDTQQTSLVESLFLLRESNDIEQEILLTHLFQTDIQFLVHLGDMVFMGSSREDWEWFDNMFQPLIQQKIPILPVMGNHEYYGYNPAALENIFSRFPKLKDSLWYSHIHQNLGLIFIDTNQEEYSEAKWEEQIKWYENTIEKMDANPAIRAILVFAHHPPFTNSTIIDDTLHVKDNFVTATFYDSKKTIAFFSGHAHGYERFEDKNKTFIISGGGGGPRVEIFKGEAARRQDIFTGPSLRPLNYLRVYSEPNYIKIEVVGLYKGETGVQTIEEIELPFPLKDESP